MTAEELKKEIEGNIPVIVDFYATWCAPCKYMTPVMDELGEKYARKIKVIKIDIDESREAMKEYGIRSVPTFLFFKAGEIVDTRVGLMPKGEVEKIIEELV